MVFNCYYCGNKSAEAVADKTKIRFGADRQVLKCLKCGLVQLFPRSELSYDGYSEKKDFPGQKIKQRISKHLPNLIGRKNRAKIKILEVGCGDGSNLRYLYEKGFHTAYGIDKDPTVCNKSSILNKDWRKYNPKIKLDVIYGIHFLEHVAEPYKFIAWVRRTLKEGGRFIFEVPCVEDPLIKLYKNKAYDKFCWYPYHMFFYSKKSLENLFFGRIKVEVFRRQGYGIVNHLRWLFRGKPGNWNPHIPIIDDAYKFVLKELGYSDSLIVVGKNV